MAKPIRIPAGEIDFEKLLKRLSDDIAFAPAFLRIDKQLGEYFEKDRDEVNQAWFFWSMVSKAVPEAGLLRLARIYDQQKNALSLGTLIATIKANTHLFHDSAVAKRVNPLFAKSIVPGGHVPDAKRLTEDLALVSANDPLVNKIVIWRNHFLAHVSSGQTIEKTLGDTELITKVDADDLCNRARDIFNRYTSLFHAVHHSKLIIGEEGSVESVFRHLRSGLAAGRRERDEATKQWFEALESAKKK